MKSASSRKINRRIYFPTKRGSKASLYIRALAEGWPGLLLFILVMLVAFTMGDR